MFDIGQEVLSLLPPEPWFYWLEIMNQRALRVFEYFLFLILVSSGVNWRWQKKTPGKLSNREREAPHILMVTSKFYRDVQKGLLQSPILLGRCDITMVYNPKGDGLVGQGLIIFQIGFWAVQGCFRQKVEELTPKVYVIGLGICDSGISLLSWDILRVGQVGVWWGGMRMNLYGFYRGLIMFDI